MLGWRSSLVVLAVTVLSARALADEKRAASPAGRAETQIGTHWIEVDYSRPIKRARADLFGTGAEYGKKLNAGAPVWRAGANQTTRLKTEAPLEVGGKKLAPGEYSLFVELKEVAWTLIVSNQPFLAKYDPNEKKATWGSYNYDPKFDLVRVPMKNTKLGASIDQFTIGFVDVSAEGGKIGMAWDREAATAEFKVSK
jgi:hypothetical protein